MLGGDRQNRLRREAGSAFCPCIFMWAQQLLQRRLRPEGMFPAGATNSIPSSPQHFADFCEQYDEKYAATYGMYRLERIRRIGEWYSTCGD